MLKQKIFKKCWLVLFAIVFLLNGCGGGGGGSSSDGDTSGAGTSGVAVDPYITGAVFEEVTPGGDVLQTSTASNRNGRFNFKNTVQDDSVIRMKKNNKGSHIGKPYEGDLQGAIDPAGELVVSPLTTLLGNGFTAEQVITMLDDAGISGLQESDLYDDPMAGLSGLETFADDQLILLQASIAVNTYLLRLNNFSWGPDDEGDVALLAESAEMVKYCLSLSRYQAVRDQLSTTLDDFGSPLTIDHLISATSNLVGTLTVAARNGEITDPVAETEILVDGLSELSLNYYVQENRGDAAIEEAVNYEILPDIGASQYPQVDLAGEVKVLNGDGSVATSDGDSTTEGGSATDSGSTTDNSSGSTPVLEPITYPAPILESVEVAGNDFVLNWSLPSGVTDTPDGGYDIIIDGLDTNSTWNIAGTSQTISGLDAQVAHTFMVEARWTQADPSQFARSNQLTGMIELSDSGSDTNADSGTWTNTSLRGDINFNINLLPAQARTWYDRLWKSINNSSQYLNATTLAQSNDTYNYARSLNTHITSLLHAFRVTGDLRLLDEVDSLTQIMRSKLQDRSILSYGGSTYQSDGYLNWLYFYDAGYEGTDVHQMDEMLTHSLVASFAYAFYVNRDLDSKYAERAAFWTDYLKNHFEAKWRERKGISSGFPFLTKKLAHVHVQWTRYHYYMYKLTGEIGYYNEALKMADDIKNHLEYVNTSLGDTAQWDHGMPILGGNSYGPQPTHYSRYTMHGMADLSFENFSIYADTAFMKKVANTLAYFVLNAKAPAATADDIAGNGEDTADRYAISPFAEMAYWDDSGRIENVSTQIFENTEGDVNNPRRVYIPAGMFLNSMKNN